MRAGRLRHRITIQEKTSAQNTYGEHLTWTDVCTVWASIEPLYGQEFMTADREGASVTTRIVMRYRSGIAPSMRVTEGSHTWDIQSIINLREIDHELHLMCREVVTT